MADRFTSSVYDSKGRFETSTQNALGHTTTKDYDDYFGNVISVISPNNLETQYFYDEFGNMTRTLAPDGNEVVSSTHWVVETDPDAPAGAIYYSRTQASGGPAGIEYYDQQGRTMRKVTTGFEEAVIYADTRYNLPGQVEKVSEPYFKVGGTPLWKEYEYDLLGRVTEVTLPGNRITTTVYGGLTTTVTGPLNKTMAQTTDVLGNLVESKDHNLQTVTYDYFSSGLVTEKTFNPNTGFIENIHTGTIQNMGFQWDARGNLLQRSNSLKSRTEDFTYDNLDRLETSTVNGYPTISVDYDALGNITSKSDVATGTFTYGLNAGPNALTRVNGNTGAISTVAQDIDYSSFNKVTRIAEGSNEVQFTYGPEYARKIMRRYENSIQVLRKSMLGFAERENRNFLPVCRWKFLLSSYMVSD